MIHSMTAFAQVQCQLNSVMISWELRSLNHRYLDVTFRLPDALRHLEARLRQRLRGAMNRGKLDVQLRLTDVLSEQAAVRVDESMVQALIKEGHRLAEAHGLADDLKLSHILAWPGVMDKGLSVTEDLEDKIEQLFYEGLKQLLAGRQSEGVILESQIQSRLALLRQEVAVAREQTSSIVSVARQRLKTRLDELQMNVADSRLEQELAFILTRLDVSEELDRLDAHVDEVEHILKRDESSGKRLDFMMQELNREANTLSSKSDAVALTQHAVQMKVLIEQMREQIQNIE